MQPLKRKPTQMHTSLLSPLPPVVKTAPGSGSGCVYMSPAPVGLIILMLSPVITTPWLPLMAEPPEEIHPNDSSNRDLRPAGQQGQSEGTSMWYVLDTRAGCDLISCVVVHVLLHRKWHIRLLWAVSIESRGKQWGGICEQLNHHTRVMKPSVARHQRPVWTLLLVLKMQHTWNWPSAPELPNYKSSDSASDRSISKQW